MTTPRDPDEILAAWLDEGPDRLPEQTRRAIAVALPTITRRRRGLPVPWRFPDMHGPLRLALGAVAVMAVALGGLFLYGRGPNAVIGTPSSPTQTPAPSASPSSLIPLTQTFTSRWYGYSIRYPADPWGAMPATTQFEPVAWEAANGPTSWMDVIRPVTDGFLRIASAKVPQGEDGEAWIATYYGDCTPKCEDVIIDGQHGRLGEDPTEIEATLVMDDRAYVFTLFTGNGALADGRALFEAFMATVDLRPDDAIVAPMSSPSP